MNKKNADRVAVTVAALAVFAGLAFYELVTQTSSETVERVVEVSLSPVIEISPPIVIIGQLDPVRHGTKLCQWYEDSGLRAVRDIEGRSEATCQGNTCFLLVHDSGLPANWVMAAWLSEASIYGHDPRKETVQLSVFTFTEGKRQIMLRIFLVATFLSLTSACWAPQQYGGPLCDIILNGEPWPSGGRSHDLDHINSAPWLENPQMTEYLFGFGMSKARDTWLDLGLDDPFAYNEETLLVDSPFGRAMNAYTQIALSGTNGEYLDVSVSLEDFEHYDNMLKWFAGYVYQRTWRVEGSCGNRTETSAVTYFRVLPKNNLIVVYDGFFNDYSVSRAASIVHEVRHADGRIHTAPDLCISCDNSWTDNGTITYELLWLAAYYWAPENEYISSLHRIIAANNFQKVKTQKLREPMEWTLEDFKDINENPEYYLKIATLYNDVRPR